MALLPGAESVWPVAKPIGNADEVTARVQVLRSRKERARKVMERLDNWRYMERDKLQSEIWPTSAPTNANRWTIIKPDIAATTATVIAMATSKRVKIMASPRNTISASALDSANQVERIAYAEWDTINRDRDTPLDRETSDHCFHRGEMVTKVLRLSPEERGAETAQIEPAPYDDPDLMATDAPMEVVVSEERFPLLVESIDPYEVCVMMAPDGRLLELVHEYDDAADSVLAQFPELEGMKEFSDITSGDGSGTVKVTDYWTTDEHCILLNNIFFKQPTKHEYPRIPFQVDLAASRAPRFSDRGAYAKSGTPFCADMLDTVAKASMAESWLLAQLEMVAFAPPVHENVDADNSPYMKQGAGNVSEYTFELELGPGQKVHPLFSNDHGGERLKFVEMPPAAPALMQFMGGRSRDAALLAFPDEMLMGAGGPAMSGYAYAQMKHGVYSKTAPYFAAIDRHLSGVMMLVNDLLVYDWDRAPEVKLSLTALVGKRGQKGLAEATLDVTKEMLADVSTIRVEIQPDMPIDQEKEWTMLLQTAAQGMMSKRTAMNEMGVVADPTIEFEDIVFENFVMNDQNSLMAIVAKVLQRNGYQSPQPQPQPAVPGAMPAGDPSMMAPALPPDPAMAAGMVPAAAPVPALNGAMSGPLPPMQGPLPPGVM